jgi:hypothetical protein
LTNYSLTNRKAEFTIPGWILVLVIFFQVLFSGTLIAQGENWRKVKDSDGIQSYVMKLPDLDVNKVKVETIIKSSLASLVSLIIDTPRNVDWVFLNTYAITSHHTDHFNWVYYGQNNAPWPVCDRDVVTRVHLWQNPTTKEVVCESVADPSLEPEHEGFVRIPMLRAVWRFIPLGDKKVKVVFELVIDLGGNMPAWLTNLAVTKGPSSSIKKFIALVGEEPYLSAHLDYIKEPQW